MQTRFTLRQLEYLVAVGRFKSVTLAAEALAVSPPSISSAISQLEQEFGLPLFVRKHAHGMALTPSGRELTQKAAKVLEAAKDLSSLADQHKGTVRGDLNLGCLLTFAQVLVPRLRRAYAEAHPQVTFRQYQNHQEGLIEALRDASIDIALTYDLSIPADLEFVQLAVLPPFAILAEDHPLATRIAVSLEDLAPLPMILLDLPVSCAYFLSLFDKLKLKPRIFERAQDPAVVHSLVGNGFGYSIANFRPWRDIAPDGKRLRFVPILGAHKPMRMGLMCAAGAKSALTVQAFVDLCQLILSGVEMSELTVKLP